VQAKFWWLTPLLLLVVAATEIALIVELRGVKNETRTMRESFNKMLASFAALTLISKAVDFYRDSRNDKTPPE
jgi:hypothetical protein